MAKAIGQAKRQDNKLIMGCIKNEIKAGRRDETIAKILGDSVSPKQWVNFVRWMLDRAPAKARRY